MDLNILNDVFFDIIAPISAVLGSCALLLLSLYARLYRRAEHGDGDTPRFHKNALQKIAHKFSAKVSPWQSKPKDYISVRLWGIDAPEKNQEKWGAIAQKRMNQLLPPGTLCWLDWHGTAAWNRPCAEPFLLPFGKSLCIVLLEEGLSEVDSRYCDDARYFEAEKRAQKAKKGIWSDLHYVSARTFREQSQRLRKNQK
jgi:endonuclease YncB( thermonuclease family)